MSHITFDSKLHKNDWMISQNNMNLSASFLHGVRCTNKLWLAVAAFFSFLGWGRLVALEVPAPQTPSQNSPESKPRFYGRQFIWANKKSADQFGSGTQNRWGKSLDIAIHSVG